MDYLHWLKAHPAMDPPSEEALAAEAHQAGARLRLAARTGDLGLLIDHLSQAYGQIESDCQKLILASYYDPTDRQARESFQALSDHALAYLTEYASLFSALSDLSRARRGAQALDPGFLAAAKSVGRTYDKALLPLLKEEKAAIETYMQGLDDMFMSKLSPARVKGEARRLLQSMSRDRRKRAYQSLEDRMLGFKSQLEVAFTRLHEVRRTLGQEGGFSSFYDYALARGGLTEAMRARIKDFRQLVQKHLLTLSPPIMTMQWERLGIQDPRPWDLMYPANFGLPTLDPQAFPLDETYIKALSLIFPDGLALSERMQEEGGLTLGVTGEPGLDSVFSPYCTGAGMSGVLAANFTDLNRSFLVLSQIPQESLGSLLFSETGFLLLDQSDQKTRWPFPPPAERDLVHQLARYSMVFLSQRAWHLFYGSKTPYARQYDLSQLALDIPLYCALDEMEEFLCRARVTNLAVFRHAWNEIANRYGLAGTWSGHPGLVPVEDLWLYSPLLWARPLTGIFQTLAAVSVLATFPLGRRHQALENNFRRLLDLGGQGQPLESLIQAGYPSPFQEETVIKASFAIMDFLAL